MPAPNVEEVQVPCSLFLGLNTEVAPPDLPEGVSPACQDVAFVPGNVFSRPCLHKIFGSPFPGNPTVIYQKTFLQPNFDPLNLYTTSDGNLWCEDILNSPGVHAELAEIIAGLWGQSITASGAEYLACSNGLQGADVPRQIYRTPDGTLQVDRVSQDGPGAGPTIADFRQTLTIDGSIGFGAAILFNSGGATESGNTVTVTTTTAHGFYPGQYIYVGLPASPYSPYNGLVQILTTPSTTTFTYQVSAVGLSPGGSGFCVEAIAYLVVTGISGNLQLHVGDNIVIAGNSSTFVNGSAAITLTGTVNTDSTGLIVTWVSGEQFSSALEGNPININGASGVIAAVTSPTSLILEGPVPASLSGVSYSAALNNPATWPVVSIVNDGSGNWTIGFSFAAIPSDVVIESGSGGGTVFLGGQSSPGIHQVVVMFLTRSGYLTAPSPPISFNSAGNTQWQLTNLPIGPPNVVARVFGFTGAGGDNFFTITSSIQFPNPFSPTFTPIVIQATTVNDNTSTSCIIDTSDNALFGAQGIDIDGNDLFNQVVLGPCLFFFYYASRLIAAGMANKLENFLNMGFEGGYLTGVLTTPLAWTVVTGNGALTPGGASASGQAWRISTDNSGNPNGQISQPAYQNSNGVPIIEPSTQYTFRAWIDSNQIASGTANVVAELYSPSAGSLAKATISVPAVSAILNGLFLSAEFSAVTPAVIPADAVFRISANSTGFASAPEITVDELEVIPTFDPYFESFLISYVDNFEAFDGVTGVMGPTSDPNPLRGCETIRDQLQFLTSGGMHQTSDNGEEPSSWIVSEISNDTGLAAFRALDAGEECIVFVGKSGGGDGTNPTYALRIYEGGQPWKISQEVQRIFDNVNPEAEETMWLVNDIGQRRIYIGVPTGDATAPSQFYVLDYREIDTAYQIAQAPSIHISFTGKMIASDLARKWAPWNIQANCGAMLARPGNNTQFCLGAGNGVTPGTEAGFGNVYYLDPLKFTDDDYGVMSPFYVMYFFLSRDTETALGVGSMRKLYKGLSEFISGIGNLTITPYAASLSNPWPSPPTVELTTSPIQDFYHGLNVSTERMAIKFAVTPLEGETDVQFNLQHMEARIQQHPMSPFGTGATI